MKKTLITTAVIATLLGASASAIAASGFYISGGAGMSFLRGPSQNLKTVSAGGTTTSVGQKYYNFTGRVAAGYRYQVNSAFGLGAELGYDYLGNASYTGSMVSPTNNINAELKYRQMAVDLLAVVTYNFTPAWSVNAKAGGAYVMQKSSYSMSDNGVATTVNSNTHKILPEVAAGVSYNLNKHVAVGLEGTYMFGTKPVTNNVFNTPAFTKAYLNKVISNGTVMATVTYTF